MASVTSTPSGINSRRSDDANDAKKALEAEYTAMSGAGPRPDDDPTMTIRPPVPLFAIRGASRRVRVMTDLTFKSMMSQREPSDAFNSGPCSEYPAQ